MADGAGNGIGGIATEAVQAIKTDIVKPVGEEIGKLIETGVQSVTDPLDPQKQAAQQQAGEQRKKEAETRRQRILKWVQDFQRAEQQNKQQNMAQAQKKQQEVSQDDQKKQIKQFEVVKKREEKKAIDVTNKQNRTETRKGVGG